MHNPDYHHSIFHLGLSMFLGMLGTNLFLVSMSVEYYSSSSSNLAAAAVYVAQFLPSIVLMPLAWRVCDTMPIRAVLVRLEALSCVVTLSVGALVLTGHPQHALALLVLRGFVEMTTKSARNVAVRTLTSAEQVAAANNWIMGANFSGQAVGAVVGFWLITRGSLSAVTASAATTFAISALVCSRLPLIAPLRESADKAPSLFRTATAILSNDAEKARALAYLLSTVILLQSFNQVLRVGLPLTWLGLPTQTGAVNEIIGSVGVLLGLLVIGRFYRDGRLIATREMRTVFAFAVVASVSPFVLPRWPCVAFPLYLVFMLLFEISFMLSLNGLLARSRKEEAPTLMVLFYGAAFGGMSIVTVMQAAAVDRFGFQAVSAVILSVGLAAAVLTERLHCPRPKLQPLGMASRST